MLIKLYSENPNPRELDRVVGILKEGGVIAYPTDTVYGIGCDITKPRSVERIIKLKGLKSKEAQFSFICSDLSQVTKFARLDNHVFRIMKRNLPGPFTFILPGLNKVPDYFLSRRKTVGIRIPDSEIIIRLVRMLGNPILTTSIKDDDNILEYTTNPDLIHDKYEHLVDIVVDGGFSDNIPSTVVDCTDFDPVIIRQGKGVLVL